MLNWFDVESQTRSLFPQRNPNKKKEAEIKFPDIFPVKINGKWGYINRSGQIVVEPRFDYASNFGSASIAIIQNENLYGLIDLQGKVILHPVYRKLVVLSDGFVSASSDSLWGVFKTDGTQVMREQFTKVKKYSSKYFLTYEGEYAGLADLNGKTIVPNKYFYIQEEDSSFLKVTGANGIGLYTNSGEEILSDNYENIDVVNNKVIMCRKNTKWGAISKTRDTLFLPVYQNYSVSSNLIFLSKGNENSLFSIRNMKLIFSSNFSYTAYNTEFISCIGNGKMGIIDYSGKILVDTSCTDVKFQNGYFIFRKNGRWGLVSAKGKVILDPDYDVITIADNNVFKVYQEQHWGLANSKGKVIYGPSAQNIDYVNRIAKIYDNKKLIILEIDEGGNEIDRSEYENVGTININNKYNTIDNFRNYSMKPLRMLRNKGWFLDTLKNRWGLMDTLGNVVIPPMYKNIEVNDTIHLTMVSRVVTDAAKNRVLKYGIIDHENYKTVAPVMYDFISFNDLRKKNMARGKLKANKLTYLSLKSPEIDPNIGFTDEFRNDDYARVNFGGSIVITNEFSTNIIDSYNNYYYSLYGFYPFNAGKGYQSYVTCKGGKWGFVNNAGEEVFPFEYDFVSRYIKDRFIACRNEKWGVVALNKTIVNFDYDYISRLKNSYDSLFVLEIKVTKTGLMDTKGHLLTSCKYDEISPFSEGMARVKIDSKYGYINQFGSEVIPCEYLKADHFSEGLAPVKQKYKWGYMNDAGKFVIEPKYRIAYNFHEGLAGVCLKSKFGFIDKYQNIVIPFIFSNVSDFSNGKAIVKKGNKSGVINKEGEWIIKPKYRKIMQIQGHEFYLVTKKRSGLVSCDGNQVVKRRYVIIGDFCNGLALVKRNGKYGFIDTIGKVVIPLKYASAKYFNDGLAAVKMDTLWGFIDPEGELIIEALYTQASGFSNGRAVVLHNGIYKIIDKRGEVIKEISSKILPFSEDLAVVKNDKQSYFINLNGEKQFRETFLNATPFNGNHAFVLNPGDNKKEYEFCESYMNRENYWALINSDGVKLTGHYYSSLKDLSKGFITYKIPEYHGIADHSGKIILPAEYESIEYVGWGLFKVITMNKIGYIKSTGEWLWKPAE